MVTATAAAAAAAATKTIVVIIIVIIIIGRVPGLSDHFVLEDSLTCVSPDSSLQWIFAHADQTTKSVLQSKENGMYVCEYIYVKLV